MLKLTRSVRLHQAQREDQWLLWHPWLEKWRASKKRAITIEGEGLTFSLKAGELVNLSVEGLPGANEDGEPIYLEHVPHPANSRLALAKATNSEFHAFGIDWDDSTGLRNGHFQNFLGQLEQACSL